MNIKYDRSPLGEPLRITETPNKQRQHHHLDIVYLDNKQTYITCTDKFSKFAAIANIRSRNWTVILKGIKRTFATMVKPSKLTFDNEPGFKQSRVRQYFLENQIQTKYTTPGYHTGNSDVERLYNTLIENIRVLRIRKRLQELDESEIEEEFAINNYNNIMHSTIQEKQFEVHNGIVNNYEVIQKTKRIIC